MNDSKWLDEVMSLALSARMFIAQVDCGYIPIVGSEMQIHVDTMREDIKRIDKESGWTPEKEQA